MIDHHFSQACKAIRLNAKAQRNKKRTTKLKHRGTEAQRTKQETRNNTSMIANGRIGKDNKNNFVYLAYLAARDLAYPDSLFRSLCLCVSVFKYFVRLAKRG